MRISTISALALVALSAAGTVSTASASTASPSSVHLVSIQSTPSAAQSQVNAYIAKVKTLPGASNIVSGVDPVSGGWRGEIDYSSTKPFAGDTYSAQLTTDAASRAWVIGDHSASGFATQTEAQNHALWTINQLKAQPNSFQPDASQPRGFVVYNTASKTYTYYVSYLTTGSRLFVEDSLVENTAWYPDTFGPVSDK